MIRDDCVDAPPALFAGPPRYAASSPWHPVAAMAVAAAACLAALIVALAGVIGALLTRGADGELSSEAAERLFSLGTPSGIGIAAGTQLVSLLIIWLAAGYRRRRPEVLQLVAPAPAWSTLAAGALMLVAVTSALEFLLYATTSFDIFADTKWLRDGLSSPYWWGTVLIGVIFAPLWEEFAFRGFLLSALAQTRLGFLGGALFANVMWTLLHWGYSWQGLASVFAAGLVLSWILFRTGSIWAAIGAHAVANACSLAFVHFAGG